MSKIQNEDVKTLAQITGAGGSASQLINDTKIYVTANGLNKQLSQAIADGEIGGGGGINYITNPSAESNTTGWATYQDAAGTSPVNGIDGTANTTWTRSTSSPLRDSASFLMTKSSGASRQGEGVSYDFSIDPADQGKVLQGSFDYAIASGTFADDAVRVFIYDVTNAALISCVPSNLKNHTLPGEKFGFEFQAPVNSTSFRLILHIAGTDTVAYNLKFDNFSVGPQAKLYGSPVTDWISFAPTGSWVTNTTYTGRYRRVGDSVECMVNVALSGAPTSAALTINLPSGLSIDTAKLVSTTSLTNELGQISWLEPTSGTGKLLYNNSTSLTAVYQSSTAGVTSAINATAPVTWGAGDSLQLIFKAPILGYSSSLLISNDASTRVVAARMSRTSGSQAISGATVLDWTSTVHDTHAAIDLSGNTFTAPVSGYYRSSGFVLLDTGSGEGAASTSYTIDGAGSTQVGQSGKSASTAGFGFLSPLDFTVFLRAGQVLRTLSTNLAGSPSFVLGTWNIEQVQGPAQIAASESVNFRVSSSSGQTLTAGGTTTINYPTKDFDSFNAVSGGVFTAPISGKYQFMAAANIATQGSGATRIIGQFNKNSGTLTSRIVMGQVNAGQSYLITDIVNMAAGDTMRFEINTDASGSIALSTEGIRNFFSGERVGN
jgi:hypothetical protein